MIHHALRSIPARPILIIAPLLVATVMVLYYANLRRECMTQAQLRKDFLQSVEQAAASQQSLDLKQVTGFTWQFVKGFESFRPEHKNRNCPFGWDWSADLRRTLIERGLLSILIFFDDKRVVQVLEFSNQDVSLQGFGSTLDPDQAQFSVSVQDSGDGYVLQPD